MEDLLWTIAICCIGVLLFLQPYIHNKLRSRKWKSNVTYTHTANDPIPPVKPATAETAAVEPVVVEEPAPVTEKQPVVTNDESLDEVAHWLYCNDVIAGKTPNSHYALPTIKDAEKNLVAFKLHRQAQLELREKFKVIEGGLVTKAAFLLFESSAGTLKTLSWEDSNLNSWLLTSINVVMSQKEYDFSNYVKRVFPIPKSANLLQSTLYSVLFHRFHTPIVVDYLQPPSTLGRDIVEFETRTPIELRNFEWYAQRHAIVESALGKYKGKWIYINDYGDWRSGWFFIELIAPCTDPTLLNSNGFGFYGRYLFSDRTAGNVIPIDVLRRSYATDAVERIHHAIETVYLTVKQWCDENSLTGLAELFYDQRYEHYDEYRYMFEDAIGAGIIPSIEERG